MPVRKNADALKYLRFSKIFSLHNYIILFIGNMHFQ